MLGNTLMNYFIKNPKFNVYGTARSEESVEKLHSSIKSRLIFGIDIDQEDIITSLFDDIKPDVVINCIGLVKQLADSNDPLSVLPVNSLFPHKLAKVCSLNGSRLIHISTDCVFSGSKGMYKEEDIPDAIDLYGLSKRIGEVKYSNTITLRTSIIGHELNGNKSLVDWFLSQQDQINGYTNAVFSGLPTVEIAYIIENHVIPFPELEGLYHVSAYPINKFELLNLISSIYNKKIKILEDNSFKIDRSLDSTLFKDITGYTPPDWKILIKKMYEFKEKSYFS